MASDHEDQHKPASLPSENPSESFWHTQPSPLLLGHRTTRDLPTEADVVIIGSGITGASVAHHLLDHEEGVFVDGHDVVMLEAREACWGATGRVSFLFSNLYFPDFSFLILFSSSYILFGKYSPNPKLTNQSLPSRTEATASLSFSSTQTTPP